MRHLHTVSLVMVAAGVVVAALAGILSLDEAWMLGGLLLAFAGAVKLVIVALWRNIAGFADATPPDRSLPD